MRYTLSTINKEVIFMKTFKSILFVMLTVCMLNIQAVPLNLTGYDAWFQIVMLKTLGTPLIPDNLYGTIKTQTVQNGGNYDNITISLSTVGSESSSMSNRETYGYTQNFMFNLTTQEVANYKYWMNMWVPILMGFVNPIARPEFYGLKVKVDALPSN